MSDYDYERDDPNFVADLTESHKAVEKAAAWLRNKGYPVIVRPTFVRPDVSERGEYADDGDIEILQRIEVKRRISMTFSGEGDFPYDTLIVDACHCYDKANPKPYAYIIFNRDMTAAFIVDVKSTRRHWQRTTRADRQKARVREFYECPVSILTVERMA